MSGLPGSSADVAEPCVKGLPFFTIRSVLQRELGDEGFARVVAVLPPQTRERTIEQAVFSRDWVPTRHLIAWYQVIFEVAAGGDEARFLELCRFLIDDSFGRVRRVFLKLATVGIVAKQATSLWSDDHSHGQLTAQLGDRSLVLTLVGTPIVHDALSRRATAEHYRHIVSLTGCRDVKGTSDFDGERLVVHIAWA